MISFNPISVVHARPIIPSRYMEALSDDNDDNHNMDQENTIEIGKKVLFQIHL